VRDRALLMVLRKLFVRFNIRTGSSMRPFPGDDPTMGQTQGPDTSTIGAGRPSLHPAMVVFTGLSISLRYRWSHAPRRITFEVLPLDGSCSTPCDQDAQS
jgi:hypothetical protein